MEIYGRAKYNLVDADDGLYTGILLYYVADILLFKDFSKDFGISKYALLIYLHD